MKKLMILLPFFVVVACSRSFEKDYKVVDASHKEIPEWVTDMHEWLDDEVDSDDLKENRFYIYQSEAKNSREISCKIAKAESTASVASEISTFIKDTFAKSKQGDASSTNEALSEYIQNDLYKEVKATITGVQEYRQYWEKRRFMQEEGAAKDWEGYVCSVLVKVPKSHLKKAFERTEKLLANQLKSDSESQEKVTKMMQEASNEYTK